jgi:hypothetical protein
VIPTEYRKAASPHGGQRNQQWPQLGTACLPRRRKNGWRQMPSTKAQLIARDGNTAADAQLQPQINLITSLLKAIEEQKQAHAK